MCFLAYNLEPVRHSLVHRAVTILKFVTILKYVTVPKFCHPVWLHALHPGDCMS